MYHDLFTEKSWQILKDLKRQHGFMLIGGWAVYLYTRQLKSKDIDIIVGYELLDQFRNSYDLQKNDRLKKYEIHIDEIDVDIYVPFFSNLGIPVEEILHFGVVREGFSLPQKEVLLILKQKAWQERKGSLKGEKDELDILSLVREEIDWPLYRRLLAQYKLSSYSTDLLNLVSTRTAAEEIQLNSHQYSKFRKKIFSSITP